MFGKAVGQTNGGAVGIMDLRLTHITLKILHCSHLGIGWFISIGLLPDTGKQFIPLLHEGMRFHHHHETDMISHCLTITLEDVREIHKSVIDLARGIHHPRLLGLTQETLQTFAHNGAPDIEYEVREISLIITYQRDSLIEKRVHGLTTDQQRASGLQEHTRDMAQRWQTQSSVPQEAKPPCSRRGVR